MIQQWERLGNKYLETTDLVKKNWLECKNCRH